MIGRGGFAALSAGFAIALFTFAASTQAMTSAVTSGQVEDQLKSEIENAQGDLLRHEKESGLTAAANAETTLLNAQMAGLYKNEKVLDDLKSAHTALLHKNVRAAQRSLGAASARLAAS